MGVKMAECEPPVLDYFSSISDSSSTTLSSSHTSQDSFEPTFLPYWARYETKCAQNLLDCSDEPIEYDHDDEDYRDNCFFFPEDCSWTPLKDWIVEANRVSVEAEIQVEDQTPLASQQTNIMIPGLPDIKMLDAEALSDLLEDNLSPPEITTIMYNPRTLHPQTSHLTVTSTESLQPTALSSRTVPPSPPVNCATLAPPTAPPTHATRKPLQAVTLLVSTQPATHPPTSQQSPCL
jgi:hypothetical protein